MNDIYERKQNKTTQQWTKPDVPGNKFTKRPVYVLTPVAMGLCALRWVRTDAFLNRLVGIIPPPGRHLVRYAGVFGPASKHRAKLRMLVPATDTDDAAAPNCSGSAQTGSSRARRLPWADLLWFS